MLGTTHMATGIAASLAILRPTTVTGVICAVSGGAIGGLISDIDKKDVKNLDFDSEGIPEIISQTLLITGVLLLDYCLGNGICNFITTNWGIKSILGYALLFIGCVFGYTSKHRSFTHSILGLIFYSLTLSMVCLPLAFPFFIGMLSHILLDLTTRKPGLVLFYPSKKRFCLNYFHSGKKANTVIMMISVIIAIILAAWMSIYAVINEDISKLYNYNAQGALPWFTIFQWYLIIINVFTFIVSLKISW